ITRMRYIEIQLGVSLRRRLPVLTIRETQRPRLSSRVSPEELPQYTAPDHVPQPVCIEMESTRPIPLRSAQVGPQHLERERRVRYGHSPHMHRAGLQPEAIVHHLVGDRSPAK